MSLPLARYIQVCVGLGFRLSRFPGPRTHPSHALVMLQCLLLQLIVDTLHAERCTLHASSFEIRIAFELGFQW